MLESLNINSTSVKGPPETPVVFVDMIIVYKSTDSTKTGIFACPGGGCAGVDTVIVLENTLDPVEFVKLTEAKNVSE